MNQSRQLIVNGSAHNIPLPDGFVHTVVTSPPYYSLRKYAGEQQVDWPTVEYSQMPGMPPIQVEPMRCALGLEPTPEAYIGHLVLCFREVMRVLRDDGTAWVVMGDSYGGGQGGNQTKSAKQQSNRGTQIEPTRGDSPGNLLLIPARLALALQADGWLVRNDPPWAKLAPMPESVSGWRWERCRVKVRNVLPGDDDWDGAYGNDADAFRAELMGRGTEHKQVEWRDCPGCEKCAEHGGYVLRRGSWRHTRAHETVLMLAKSMGYYADQERVREAVLPASLERVTAPLNTDRQRDYIGSAQTLRMGDGQQMVNPAGRNPRSVLTPRPESYSGSHYAVFPRTLISPLLQATAPTRVCPVCAAPWCPVVEREKAAVTNPRPFSKPGNNDRQDQDRIYEEMTTTTTAHRPTCDCGREDWQPGWVLDTFVGSGTTLEVCRELGVNGVGLDISPQYLDEHAKPRIGLTPSGALETLPLFEGMDL